MMQIQAEDPCCVGVDVGGTFTDLVLLQKGRIRTAKVLSTQSPEQGVLAALAQAGIPGSGEESITLTRFCHGMTVATNALLERKGVPTLLLTTAGFGDLLWLARQHRPHLYDLTPIETDPVVMAVEEVN
ncbi:MAG: hydantoinase/oxoprolinase family protein, partial [Synechococcaceae cyanobacterium SM2_3_2]|nr:hydantoinase/oxoprolinase family protein [Synechococcaceae cyanobacterium SM2_3_2]